MNQTAKMATRAFAVFLSLIVIVLVWSLAPTWSLERGWQTNQQKIDKCYQSSLLNLYAKQYGLYSFIYSDEQVAVIATQFKMDAMAFCRTEAIKPWHKPTAEEDRASMIQARRWDLARIADLIRGGQMIADLKAHQ